MAHFELLQLHEYELIVTSGSGKTFASARTKTGSYRWEKKGRGTGCIGKLDL